MGRGFSEGICVVAKYFGPALYKPYISRSRTIIAHDQGATQGNPSVTVQRNNQEANIVEVVLVRRDRIVGRKVRFTAVLHPNSKSSPAVLAKSLWITVVSRCRPLYELEVRMSKPAALPQSGLAAMSKSAV